MKQESQPQTQRKNRVRKEIGKQGNGKAIEKL